MSRAVSIRRSLLVNLAVVIIVMGGAIMTTTYVGSDRIVGVLSRSLIGRTLDQTDTELRGFFQPMVRTLRLMRSWAQAGLLDEADPRTLAGLLEPLMRQHPQVSALLVADDRGREFMLMRHGERWSVRQTRRDEWGDRTRWWRWTDQRTQPVASEQELDYDPRRRPWFQGAVEVWAGRPGPVENGRKPSDRAAIHWTHPYIFFTAREPGITGSIAYRDDDGVVRVIGIDVLLSAISDFTIDLRPTPHGLAWVTTDAGRVVGLPGDPRFAGAEARREAVLKPLGELDVSVLVDARAAFESRAAFATSPFRFTSGGRRYWAGVRPFSLSEGNGDAPEPQLRIAVVAPELDLLAGVTRLRQWILGIMLAVLVGGVGRAVWLAGRYSRPIEALARQSERIGRLDLSPGSIAPSGVVEIDRLADAQERMRSTLESVSRYLPTELLRDLLHMDQAARLGGKTESLTVMFSDIDGFTPLAESMTPKKLTAHMSEYFEQVLMILRVYRATIDKLVGDSVMAFWGAPRLDKYHARNAVNAVLALRERVGELNERWAGEGRPPLPTRFGLATGRVMVGNVGSPIRLSYTAIGDTVNLASRLEALNNIYGTHVLAAEPLPWQTGDAFEWRLVDRVAVKGKKWAVRVYEPLGRVGEVEAARIEFARRYERAWSAYERRRFDEALGLLRALAAEHPDDASVVRLIDLCVEYERQPPPEDWDGSIRLMHKGV